jgi:hypothetical protein
MRYFSGVILLTGCVWICACGSGGGNPGPTLNIASGNWQVSIVSTANPGLRGLGGTSLSQTGANVTGIMHLVSPPCFNFLNDINLNGTLSGTTLKLTSNAVSGSAISATVSGSEKLLAGTYASSGGACGPPDQGTITATFVPPASGSWQGTLTSAGGTVGQVTANVTQSGPDADGLFSVSGTVTFSGTCLASGAISSGLASGSVYTLIVKPNDPAVTGEAIISGSMTDPATATAFSGFYSAIESACTDNGNISLSKS